MESATHPSGAAELARVPLFAKLEPKPMASLMSRIRPRAFRPGAVIFNKEDSGQTFYVIIVGLVKIFLPSIEGQEAVLVILKPGEFFGELSLLDGAPRSASAVAMENTETLTLDRKDFTEFLNEHPGASLAILSVLAARIRRTDDLIADAAFLDLPSRICKQLLELGEKFGRRLVTGGLEIDIRLRQQDFAGMVGATRESVNRILAGLEEEGIIEIDRQKITLLKPDLLEERYSY